MTAKEYLHQAYRLDQRINSDIKELHRLREMSTSISSPTEKDKVQTSQNTDAPFVKWVFKIHELEEKIDAEIHLLVELKEELRNVIQTVENTDEQMVLRYRYIHNMTWEEIADQLYVDARTARRWHGAGLKNVKLPINPVKI